MKYIESEVVELKEILNDKVKNEISAFLNTNGGTIYIGVRDNGEVIGISDENKDELDGRLSSWIRDVYYPNPSQYIKYYYNEDNVLVINVSRGEKQPYYLASKGPCPEGVYVRIGRTSRKALDDEILIMIKDSSGFSYEKEISDIQDLHFSSFARYCDKEKLEFNESKYKALNLVDSSGNFTNLAKLISDENKIEVKLAVYRSLTSTQFRVKKEFSGTFVDIAQQLLDYSELFNDVSAEIVDYQPQRIEVKSYPGASLREAVINALCHADFSRPSNIKVEFYTNRVEITSPGGIYGGATFEDIIEGTQSFRNPGLVNILNKLNMIENYGSGLKRILDAYKNINNDELFYVSRNFFKVILPNLNYVEDISLNDINELQNLKTSDKKAAIKSGDKKVAIKSGDKRNMKTSDAKEKIIFFIEKNGEVKTAFVAEQMELGISRIKKLLNELVDEGRIIAIGNNKNRTYKLV